MFTYLELLSIFSIAILFVFLFKVQKGIFPEHYFSNSQFILNKDVTYKMLVVRYFLILIFSLIFNFIFNNGYIVVIGIFLGSFLIVWPTLISPSEAYSDIGFITSKEKILIYLLHFIFIISSTFTAYFAIIFFPLLKDLFIEYKRDALYSIMKYVFSYFIFGPLEKKGKDYLNRSILDNNKIVDFDE